MHKRTADRILEEKRHEILGRVVEVTQALGKQSKTSPEEICKGIRRLFVGGLPQMCTKGILTFIKTICTTISPSSERSPMLMSFMTPKLAILKVEKV